MKEIITRSSGVLMMVRFWTTLHIPTCYELKTINAEIIPIRGNSDITFLPNINTLQYILTVVGKKCKVLM